MNLNDIIQWVVIIVIAVVGYFYFELKLLKGHSKMMAEMMETLDEAAKDYKNSADIHKESVTNLEKLNVLYRDGLTMIEETVKRYNELLKALNKKNNRVKR